MCNYHFVFSNVRYQAALNSLIVCKYGRENGFVVLFTHNKYIASVSYNFHLKG